MKKSILLSGLLALTLCLGACSSEMDDIAPAGQDGQKSHTTAKSYDADYFPETDDAKSLPTNTATALSRLLTADAMNLDFARTMGEMTITDAQFAEIKAYVDENLKDSTETATYENIFKWVTSNLTYAWSGDAYLDPYDVFVYKRCICQGYANLCRTMLLTQGIPTLGANGQLGNVGAHAWLYAYVDGAWIVSDPTNSQYYKMSELAKYKNSLLVQRVDIPLFEDDNFQYGFENSTLVVTKVKKCDGEALTVPYSAGGYIVRQFVPRTEIPSNVRQLYFGTNITSFGPDEMPLFDTAPNVEEAYVDAASTSFSSEEGVVYKRKSSTPVYIPRGIRRLVLRPMTTIGKNVVYGLTNVEEIVISEGTKTVEAYAIEGCPNLKTVYVPETVTSFDENAIYRCGDNVEVVTMPTGIHHVTI